MRNLLVLYSRLSLADADKEELDVSNSIKNQQSLLREYIRNHEELLEYEIMEVCDDGYSGTNFQRPGIQKVLELAKKGEVKCIMVKDFSRFGRNYIETGLYLEQIFPFLKIRFISVNDRFDSQRDSATGAIDVGFKNLMHDYYSRNMGRKISQVQRFRAEQGTIIMPTFYGYKKAADGSGELVLDEEAAKAVRSMFEKRAEGMLLREIANYLNTQKILTPSARKKQFSESRVITSEFWKSDLVAPILKDVRYTGVFIYGKTKSLNFKQTKMPESEWITAKSKFEPIISKELFERVQETFHKRGTVAGTRKMRTAVFIGKVYCGCCGRKLRKKAKEYVCSTVGNLPDVDCSQTTCTEEKISNIVLEILNQFFALEDVRVADEGKYSELNAAQGRLQKLLEKSKNKILPVYESYTSGKITLEEYENERDHLEQKIGNIQKELSDIKVEIEAADKKAQTMKLLEKNKRDGRLENLMPELVDALIEKIVVYDKDRMEIVWKFRDFIKDNS